MKRIQSGWKRDSILQNTNLKGAENLIRSILSAIVIT